MSLVERIRARFLIPVTGGTQTVVAFQKACGVYLHPSNQCPDPHGAHHRPISTHSTGFDHIVSPDKQDNPIIHTNGNGNGHGNGHVNGNRNGNVNGNGHSNGNGNGNGTTKKVIPSESNIYTIHYKKSFLHYWFTAASGLGNEEFYILFLPILFWCVDVTWARKVISMWVAVYYVGQFIKDLLLLPRPPSPPVAHLETHYSAEYGLPSTHAMIGLCMPFYLLHLTYSKDSVYPYWLGLIIAVIWVTSICLSRLYNGVHSVADIIAGLIFGSWILLLHIKYGEQLDHLVLYSWWWPYFTLILSLFLIWLYPRPDKWTNAMGDTTLIVAVGIGIYFASSRFLVPEWHALPFPLNPSTSITLITSFIQSLCASLIRAVVGSACVLTVRYVMKKISYAILTPILLPNKPPNVDPARVYAVEIPCKFIVYSCIGLTTANLCFYVFRILGV